jgi:hypothetical protein
MTAQTEEAETEEQKVMVNHGVVTLALQECLITSVVLMKQHPVTDNNS